jgi:hypothetical protein
MKRLAPLLFLALAGCNTPVPQTAPVKSVQVAGPFEGSAKSWLEKAIASAKALNNKPDGTISADEIRGQLEKAKSLFPKGTPPASMRPADKLFHDGFAEVDECARALKVADLEDPSKSQPEKITNADKHYEHGFQLIEKAVESGNDALTVVASDVDIDGTPSDDATLLDAAEIQWMTAKATAVSDLEKAQRATDPKVRDQLLAKALKSYPKGPVPPVWKKLDTAVQQALQEMQLASGSQPQQAQAHLKRSKQLTAELESLEQQATKSSSSMER